MVIATCSITEHLSNYPLPDIPELADTHIVLLLQRPTIDLLPQQTDKNNLKNQLNFCYIFGIYEINKIIKKLFQYNVIFDYL